MTTRYDVLRDLVRASKLETTIDKNVTTHTRPFGRRRYEKWAQEQILGHGGYGIVWLERKMGDSEARAELRAVKCIRVPEPKAKSEAGQYVRELEALVMFSQEKYSEFFVKMHGWYESIGWLHIAMEYCEHGDLKKHLAEVKTLPESQAQQISIQILGALASMHGFRFAHRDLKPANILIKSKPPEEEWWIKLCDFGLTKRHEQVVGSTTVRGTLGFMPPETIGYPCQGDPKTANPFSADVWCFGETVFQMLTGRATFDSLLDLQRYQSESLGFPFEPLRQANASPQAVDFIHSLMLPAPWQRLHTNRAGEHSWMKLGEQPISTSPAATPWRQPGLTVADGGYGLGGQRPLSSVSMLNDQLTQASGQWSATLTRPNPLGRPSLRSEQNLEQKRPSFGFPADFTEASGSWSTATMEHDAFPSLRERATPGAAGYLQTENKKKGDDIAHEDQGRPLPIRVPPAVVPSRPSQQPPLVVNGTNISLQRPSPPSPSLPRPQPRNASLAVPMDSEKQPVDKGRIKTAAEIREEFKAAVLKATGDDVSSSSAVKPPGEKRTTKKDLEPIPLTRELQKNLDREKRMWARLADPQHGKKKLPKDSALKLAEFKKFAATFSLSTPVPEDLASILYKDPTKRQQILAKAPPANGFVPILAKDLEKGRPSLATPPSSSARHQESKVPPHSLSDIPAKELGRTQRKPAPEALGIRETYPFDDPEPSVDAKVGRSQSPPKVVEESSTGGGKRKKKRRAGHNSKGGPPWVRPQI